MSREWITVVLQLQMEMALLYSREWKWSQWLELRPIYLVLRSANTDNCPYIGQMVGVLEKAGAWKTGGVVTKDMKV